MRLITELEELARAQESPFRAQLLREDAGRLRRMSELARAAADPVVFAVAARRLGWTQGEARTGELEPALGALIDAVYALEKNGAGIEAHARLRRAWTDLTRARMEKLVGCLSTPVPRPGPE